MIDSEALQGFYGYLSVDKEKEKSEDWNKI